MQCKTILKVEVEISQNIEELYPNFKSNFENSEDFLSSIIIPQINDKKDEHGYSINVVSKISNVNNFTELSIDNIDEKIDLNYAYDFAKLLNLQIGHYIYIHNKNEEYYSIKREAESIVLDKFDKNDEVVDEYGFLIINEDVYEYIKPIKTPINIPGHLDTEDVNGATFLKK